MGELILAFSELLCYTVVTADNCILYKNETVVYQFPYTNSWSLAVASLKYCMKVSTLLD